MKIFLDIETVPCQNEAFIAELKDKRNAKMSAEIDALKPPANLKDQEKIADWHYKEKPKKQLAIQAVADAEMDEAYRKTSFDGALGQICVIGLALNDLEPFTFYRSAWQGSEAEILRHTFDWIDSTCQAHPNVRPTFVGHNLVDFDLRFIFQRAVVLGIKPSRHIPFAAKPWDDCIYDTMQKWGARAGGSLDKITKALGLGGKGDITGAMVWDYVRDGRIDEVAEYCRRDVALTRALYKRMTFAEPAVLADVQF